MASERKDDTVIRLFGQLICVTEAEVAVVREHLPEHIRLTCAEPGCLSFAVTPTSDPMIWEVRESFVDRKAFEAHQARTRASAWYRATAMVRRDFRVEEAGG